MVDGLYDAAGKASAGESTQGQMTIPLSGMNALIREDAHQGREDSQNRDQVSGVREQFAQLR
jgi:hypothetical protein